MIRPRLLIGVTAALAMAGMAAVRGQDPQPQQQSPPQSQSQSQTPTQTQPPTFKTAVDLVAVDVNIVDNTGRPVSTLAPEDFTLTVDGKPRRVASAEFISSVRENPPTAPDAPSTFSSNATSGGGRLIMLIVDQGNIGVARGRSLLESARKFVAQLAPTDRVALAGIPGPSLQIDFTTNHELISAALPKLVGQATSMPTQYRIGVAEAYQVARGDNMAANALIDRECSGLRTPQEIEYCRNAVLSESQGIYSMYLQRTRVSVMALQSVIQRLALTPAPKTIVFMSEGLAIEREHEEVAWLGPLAARGQISMYVLQLDEPFFDAGEARMSPTRRDDLLLLQEGLDRMAGLTRGSVTRIVGSGEGTFNRLALELSGYYMLGFEPLDGDRDGKAHKIKVEIPKRKGVDVRFRSEFTMATAGTGPKSDDTALAEVLQAPIFFNDIGLKLSTYTLRDPASSKLRILLAAEIDRSLNPDGKLALAYTLADAKGRLIGSQIDREVKTPINPTSKVQTYAAFVLSDVEGKHALRLAVIDDHGRRGSVEYAFNAGLTVAGDIRATDMLIADAKTEVSQAVLPIVSAELTSGMMHGYLELYADAADVLNNASVLFEVAENDTARALDGAAGRILPPSPEAPNRRVVEGSIPLSLLPPGSYVARAVIIVDGKRVGQVTRPIRVGRLAAPVRTTSAGIKSLTRGSVVPFASRTERFDRSSVLTPQVVGFFMDRMNFGARGEPNAAPAIEHATAGRFDDAIKTLSGGDASLPSIFLSGLALYAKGDLEPAASKFRDTLRLDSEFFPAAFYLGSCYAAGGRDSEAVGAWQMSLVTESDAPFIYTLLGDALLRLHEVDHAVEILNEALTEWPDSDEVQIRLGIAYSMSGKRAEALERFEAYLTKHPEDQERHFLALKTLYEARAEGKPIRSKEEDRALFTKWASAYAATKGPQQALVEQWQRAMGK